MATLWIREYTEIASAPGERPDSLSPKFSGGLVQVAQEPGTDQTVTFSTSTQSAAFAATTRFIAIHGSAAFHYVVGSNPTATTAAFKVPSDTPIFIGVSGAHKIAVVLAA